MIAYVWNLHMYVCKLNVWISRIEEIPQKEFFRHRRKFCVTGRMLISFVMIIIPILDFTKTEMKWDRCHKAGFGF